MTLGELLDKLQDFHADHKVVFNLKWNIIPTSLRSFRGCYDQLALGYTLGGSVTVGDLRTELRSAIGKVFEGYKGGNYIMQPSTEVWAANYGESTERRIVEIVFKRENIIIKTRLIEF